MNAIDLRQDLRKRLFDEGLLFPTGVDGVYGRSETYERIVRAFDAKVRRWGERLGATALHLPPVMARRTFDSTGYLRAFPDLMGSIHVFEGSDREHAELIRRLEHDVDYSTLLQPAEVMLVPALCHHLYPMCTGRLPEGGVRFEVTGSCYRHEPSLDPVRQQTFRMHEIVYIGEPKTAQRHRDQALKIGLGLLTELGLEVSAVPANDPFFGRLGAAMAAEQKDEGLKYEGVAPIVPGADPTALLSANYHRDHFGLPFHIETADGDVAHSACLGFGTDRVAIALLAAHGFDPDQWPERVGRELFG